MAKQTAKTQQGQSKGIGFGTKLGLLLILAPMVLMMIPTVILMCVAMLPTFVAFLTDRSLSRTGWLCVGGLNFAGTVPYIASLWETGHSVENAITQVADVFALMVIYGGAGLGWMLYISVPQLLAAFMALTANHRIATMKAQQKRLIDDWGPEVQEGAEQAVAEFMRKGRPTDIARGE